MIEENKFRILTRQELADRLGMSTRTLIRWAKRGIGPKFIKPSHQVLYRLSDVDEWMNETRMQKTSEFWCRQYLSEE